MDSKQTHKKAHKLENVLLVVLWIFYILETIGAILVDGDWLYISLVAVVLIPLIIILRKLRKEEIKENE